MKIIKASDFNNLPDTYIKDSKVKRFTPQSIEDFRIKCNDMDDPINSQKELSAMVKAFIEKQIDEEISSIGKLSDYTRRWVETYNNMLVTLQKSMYGDKSVSVNFHQVSHSSIAAKIKEAMIDESIIIEPEKDEPRNT